MLNVRSPVRILIMWEVGTNMARLGRDNFQRQQLIEKFQKLRFCWKLFVKVRNNYRVVLDRFVIRCCKTRQNQRCWHQCHLSRGKTTPLHNIPFTPCRECEWATGELLGQRWGRVGGGTCACKLLLTSISSRGRSNALSCFMLQGIGLCQHWLSHMACPVWKKHEKNSWSNRILIL